MTSSKQADDQTLTGKVSAFFVGEKMAKNDIKLNIIINDSPISKDEKDKRLVDFFALLLEWQMKENQNDEKEV